MIKFVKKNLKDMIDYFIRGRHKKLKCDISESVIL